MDPTWPTEVGWGGSTWTSEVEWVPSTWTTEAKWLYPTWPRKVWRIPPAWSPEAGWWISAWLAKVECLDPTWPAEVGYVPPVLSLQETPLGCSSRMSGNLKCFWVLWIGSSWITYVNSHSQYVHEVHSIIRLLVTTCSVVWQKGAGMENSTGW